MKPAWALAGIALLGTASLAGAVVITSSGGEEEVVQQVETATPSEGGAKDPRTTPTATPGRIAGPGETLWRWANVTLMVPHVPELFVDTESTPTGSPGIRVTKYTLTGSNDFSTVLIDAENGSIIISEIRDQDRPLMDGILATVTVSELDGATGLWPYTSDLPPSSQREVYAGLSFYRPLPETGMRLLGGTGDPCCDYIGLRTARSAVVVNREDTTGGLTVEFPALAEEDRVALERWVSEIKICGSEVEC